MFFVSRRCSRRQHFLRPSKHVRRVLEYGLAVYAARHGVAVHGYLFMSNHYHLLGTDRRGQLSAFLRDFHALVARALNVHLGRWEHFWAPGPTNAPHVVTMADALKQLAYLYNNPTKDHLVARVEAWPGASSWSMHLSGRARGVERPRGFFTKRSKMPLRAWLRLESPAGAPDDWRALVIARVRTGEAAAAERRARTGRRVLGRKAVLRVAPLEAPTTPPPRRSFHPHVICADRRRRVAALRALTAFRAAHRRARRRFIAGVRDVEFPRGTWGFKLLGCNVARAPG